MQVNRLHMVLALWLLCGSCVEPFQPEIRETQESVVISGAITDQPGIHQVTVSVSTPYNNPSYMPLSGCVVRVEDDHGNLAVYQETRPGVYEADLDASFLILHRSYSLLVNTPDGRDYRSGYDSLLACPPIDTLYFDVKSQGTSDPDLTYYGLQFYSELTGSEGYSRNFRWKLEETWEYNSAARANLVWYGGQVIPVLADTINTCYMTEPVTGLFSASTRYLSENSLKRNKLNYVSNESPRLKLKYSLLVTQQSLTDEAYGFWDRMKSQSGEGGGLYETQPASTVGNIYNVEDPDEKVLGCFYATQLVKKRLTVTSDFEFGVPGYTCELDTASSLGELGSYYPYYLYSLDPLGVGPPYLNGPSYCFLCELKGGTTEKPDYW